MKFPEKKVISEKIIISLYYFRIIFVLFSRVIILVINKKTKEVLFMSSVFDRHRLFNDDIFDDDDDDENEEDFSFPSSKEKEGEKEDVTVTRAEAGLELFEVIWPTPDKIISAKRKLLSLNRFIPNKFDVIELDAELFSDDKAGIVISYKNTQCKLQKAPGYTFINNGASEKLHVGIRYPEKHHYLKGSSSDYPVDIIFAVDDETFCLFEAYKGTEEKHEAMMQYENLTSAQKSFLKKQFNRPKKTLNEESVYTPIREEQSLRLLFRTCKDTYPEATRAKVQLLFDELRGHVSNSDRADIINQISHILGIDTSHTPGKKKTYDEIMEIMDMHMYGMRDFKEKFAEFILSMQYSGKSGFTALLVGPPGVGKTVIGRVLAICCGKPFVHIDCSGADILAMSGLFKSWGGAKTGKVIDGLWETGTSDVVLMFDEIDKMTINNNGNPYSVLIKALGPQKQIHDEFLDADIDVSSTIIIATANEEKNIPGYIFNRFGDSIFYLDKYSDEDKREIAKAHIIPKLLSEYGIGSDELSFTDLALDAIAADYCEDEGMRETESCINSLIRKAIKFWVCGTANKPLQIDEDFVRKNLIKKTANNKKNTLGF